MADFDLVLLPGMDGTGVLFRPLLRALPIECRARVVGFPTDLPLDYRDLLALVREALPVGRPYLLLGESFSGPLALAVAATRPRDLAGVVLCATFVTSPVRVPRWARALARPVIFRHLPAALRERRTLGRFRTPELAALVREANARVAPAVMAVRARAVLAVDARHDLVECGSPILYLAGSEDRVVRPRCLRLMRRLRPDLRVVELAAPHLVLQVAPERAAQAIVEFAATSSAA